MCDYLLKLNLIIDQIAYLYGINGFILGYFCFFYLLYIFGLFHTTVEFSSNCRRLFIRIIEL